MKNENLRTRKRVNNSLPEINEVMLKYRLDLVNINKANNLKKEKNEIIDKNNLFERLINCKGHNLDQDIINAKQKMMKADMKSLLNKVNASKQEVEMNVLKYIEKSREMKNNEKINSLNKIKEAERKKEGKFLNKTEINNRENHLERIRSLLNREKEQRKIKNPIKLNNPVSPRKREIISPNGSNQEIKRRRKATTYKKKTENKLPMINQRIITSNSNENSSNNLINNSLISNEDDEKDVDEIQINESKLLVKKFILPKIQLENSALNSSKSKLHPDKHHKLQLSELVNDGDVSSFVMQSMRVKRLGSEVFYSLNSDERKNSSRTVARKITKKQNLKSKSNKKIEINPPPKIIVNLKKVFHRDKDRERLKHILNKDFGKLENISHLINHTLDSALELLYNNALALDVDENVF